MTTLALLILVVLAAVIVVLIVTQHRERLAWADERRALVDRAIARHTGEIVALDRQANRPKPAPDVTPGERVYVEGLS